MYAYGPDVTNLCEGMIVRSKVNSFPMVWKHINRRVVPHATARAPSATSGVVRRKRPGASSELVMDVLDGHIAEWTRSDASGAVWEAVSNISHRAQTTTRIAWTCELWVNLGLWERG